MVRMTTSQSYMRCGGPGVRVRPGRADTLRHWPFFQRISAYSAYFRINVFFLSMNHEGAKTGRNSFNMSKRSERSFSPWSLLPPVEVRPHSQLIPAYSSLFQRIIFFRTHLMSRERVRYERAEYTVWSSAFRRSEPRKRGTPYRCNALRSSRFSSF